MPQQVQTEQRQVKVSVRTENRNQILRLPSPHPTMNEQSRIPTQQWAFQTPVM